MPRSNRVEEQSRREFSGRLAGVGHSSVEMSLTVQSIPAVVKTVRASPAQLMFGSPAK